MAKKKAKKDLVVTASGDRSLSDVKKSLTDAGFIVDQVLNEIGCITGAASEDDVAKLRAIPGVADVSPSPPPIDIGPPDAPIS
jgi:hypothetical protein